MNKGHVIRMIFSAIACLSCFAMSDRHIIAQVRQSGPLEDQIIRLASVKHTPRILITHYDFNGIATFDGSATDATNSKLRVDFVFGNIILDEVESTNPGLWGSLEGSDRTTRRAPPGDFMFTLELDDTVVDDVYLDLPTGRNVTAFNPRAEYTDATETKINVQYAVSIENPTANGAAVEFQVKNHSTGEWDGFQVEVVESRESLYFVAKEINMNGDDYEDEFGEVYLRFMYEYYVDGLNAKKYTDKIRLLPHRH